MTTTDALAESLWPHRGDWPTFRDLLAEMVAEQRAEAWEEGWDAGTVFTDGCRYRSFGANPYRAADATTEAVDHG